LDGQNGVETVDKSSLMLLLIFIEMHFGGEKEVALEAPTQADLAQRKMSNWHGELHE